MIGRLLKGRIHAMRLFFSARYSSHKYTPQGVNATKERADAEAGISRTFYANVRISRPSGRNGPGPGAVEAYIFEFPARTLRMPGSWARAPAEQQFANKIEI